MESNKFNRLRQKGIGQHPKENSYLIKPYEKQQSSSVWKSLRAFMDRHIFSFIAPSEGRSVGDFSQRQAPRILVLSLVQFTQ